MTPPPPHDPTERVLAVKLGEWEVRIFEGKKQRYFLPRGMGHLQLWHPAAGVSVLTPSRLTGGRYEVFPVDDWKAQASNYRQVVLMVIGRHGLFMPAAPEVARLEHALVHELQQAQHARAS